MENIHKENLHSHSIENEDSGEKICKICHSSEEDESRFAHPCKCKGSLKYIHTECLNEWIKLTNTKKCDICNYPFKFQKKFKIDTPRNLPIKYVILFIFKVLWSAVFNILCFLFFMFKITIVIGVNSIFFESFIYTPKNISWKVLLSIIYLMTNMFHYMYIKKMYSCLTSLRSRIQTSHVLQNLINDVSLRSESTVVTNIRDTHSESGESEEQETEISQMVEINLIDVVFKVPTLQGIIDDLKMMFMMSIVSLVYPIIYFISGYMESIISSFIKIDVKSSYFLSFLDSIAAFPVLWKVMGSIAFFSTLLVVLGSLKSNTSRQFIRHMFYLVKCYSITIFSSIIMTFLVGMLSHYLFALSFNDHEPVYRFSNPSQSLIIHCMFGTIFLYLSKHFKDSLKKVFRTGLISNILKDESIRSVVEYSNNLNVSNYILAVSFNFLMMMAIPFTIFYLSSIRIDFKFRFNEKVWLFIFLKSFLLLHRNIKAIAEFFAGIVNIVAKTLSKVFDADNYLYNTDVPVSDKSRLVWGLNKKHCSKDYLSFIDKINSTIKNANTSSNIDDESSNNSSVFSNSMNESTTRRRIQSSKASPSLINSVSENEESKILEKYRITERRVKKYYGKIHDKRISIFYKPRFFGIMKSLCLFISLAIYCAIFNTAFRLSSVACKLLCLKKEETTSAFFVYFFSALITLAANIPSVLKISRNQISRYITNNTVFLAYSNIIFPFIGSLAYVILNASMNKFIEFSKAFIFLNSISTLTSVLFETFFVFSRTETYSSLYFLRQVGSFIVLKLAIFFCFIAYTRIIVFSSMYIPIFFTGIVVTQAIKITRILFSGTLMENIRDHFFLDEVDVINYDPNEEREVPAN